MARVAGHRLGVLITAISAACFAVMTICGKLSYDEGVGVPTLMLLRFAMAASLFWLIAALRAGGMPRAPRQAVVAGLLLGGLVYAAQAALAFGAIKRIDAGIAILIFYVHPAIVLVVARALGRDHIDPGRVIALGIASGGLALLLLTGGATGLAASGIVMALGAAVVYTLYLLLSDATLRGVDPFVLSALVCTGALASYAIVGGFAGLIDFGFEPKGYVWISGVALATIGGIGGVLVALPMVGPSLVSIVSTLEPALTVVLALLVFAETLTPLQTLGGLLVLAAVALIERQRTAPAAAS